MTDINPIFNIAAIQLNSGEHLQENLRAAYTQLEQATHKGANCAVLPENFAWMGHDSKAAEFTEAFGHGEAQHFLQQTAQDLEIWLIGGGQRIDVNIEGDKRAYNTSLVYNPQGEQIARYDKIHLFDADVSDGQAYLESDTIKAGEHTTLFDTGVARIGLSICYDLRFPALFQSLRQQGADVIVVPAAFTATTGKAHWKSLLRARAIENQLYIIAPAQCGTHPYGRETWGHSLCIDPWGDIIDELGNEPGNILCNIDRQKVADLRQKMPLFTHQRPAHY